MVIISGVMKVGLSMLSLHFSPGVVEVITTVVVSIGVVAAVVGKVLVVGVKVFTPDTVVVPSVVLVPWLVVDGSFVGSTVLETTEV